MQYVTTRSNEIRYSCLHALNDDRAPDGGFFVPAAEICFSPEQITSFAMKNPNQAMAEILNLLFDLELTRWDVDFAAGRYPVRLSSMVRRIAIAEMWHNVDWDFDRTVRDLTARIRGSRDISMRPGDWGQISVAIGALFGVFGELMREEIAAIDKKVDVAVPSSDFRLAMACFYARSWGLPIGDIVICCNENNNLWNLIRHGEMRTLLSVADTDTPQCDKMFPDDLERLIHLAGGEREAVRFCEAVAGSGSFFPEESLLQKLQDGIYVSVIGQSRVDNTIAASYKNHGYVFGPYSALCHAGLADYRSRVGISRHGLILSHRGALCDDGYVAGNLNMAVSTLHNIL